MRKLGSMIVAVISLCFAAQVWALPSGPYDAAVTESSDFFTTALLGTTFDFDYWFETNALPGSYQGQAWDVLVSQETSGWTFLGQVSRYYSSTDWEHASFNVPLALQGLTREVRFHLTDYGPATDPTVYLRVDNDHAAPVPEPSSLLLLGSGLLGALGFRKGFRKA